MALLSRVPFTVMHLLAIKGELEHGSAAITLVEVARKITARLGGVVEISLPIPDQTSIGVRPICTTGVKLWAITQRLLRHFVTLVLVTVGFRQQPAG